MKLNSILTKRLTRNATTVALVAGAAISIFSPLVQTAVAAPQGATVVSGQVGITRRGDVTRIRASDGAIINFQSFNIKPNETVRFLQPNANAKVLNRITGAAPTVIEGRLLANGQVYLINRAGVTFSRDAVVNVGGLIAAAGNMSDADFKSGLLKFTDSAGRVVNAGSITANNIALIGRQVHNSGTIRAEEGTVVFAAGEDVYVGQRNGRIFVKVENPSGGRSDGAAIEQSGTVEAARGAITMEAGDIYSLALRHSGRTTGRDVRMAGGGKSRVEISGEVSARNQGTNGTGGRVDITGGDVLVSSATIDVSGTNGGGIANIGGEYRGGGDLRAADRVVVSADSAIEADATRSGDGGRIVLWSNQRTEVHGSLSASGGPSGGDGGLIETSSKGVVRIEQTASVEARGGSGGKAGTWLLDPTDVTVAFLDPMDGTTFTNVSVVEAALNAGTDFVVEADNNIRVTTSITTNSATPVSLTFRAGNNIFIEGSISSTVSALNLNVFADTFPGTLATNNVGNVDISNIGPPNAQPILTLNGGTFRSAGVDFNIGNGLGNIQGASDIRFEHSGGVTGFAGTINTGGSALQFLTRPGFGAPTLTLSQALSITSGGGNVQIDGSINGNGNAVSVVAGNGTIQIGTVSNASGVTLTTTGATITATGAIGSTADVLITSAGGDVTVGSGITLTSDALSINAGAGKIVLGGVSGATTVGLTSSNAAADAISLSGVASTGQQTYTGKATLGGTYTTGGSAFTITGDTVLSGDTSVNTANGLLTFQGVIKSDGTARSLTLNSGNQRTIVQGFVGGSAMGEELSTFSATSTSLSFNAITLSGVRSSGNQTYTGRALLTGDFDGADFLITGNGVIVGTVDATGTFEITGTSNLDGTFNSAGNFTLGGTSQLGGSIGVTNNAVLISGGLTLAGDTTISAGSGNITLSSFVTGGGSDLTLNSTGATTLTGAVSGVDALTTNAGGTTEFGSTVAATGSLAINDAATVKGASYVTTGSQSYLSLTVDGTAPASVSFSGVGISSGAVDGGSKNLSFNAGTGKLALSNAVTNVGTFDATSTNAAADAISLRAVTSTGAQTYTGNTQLQGAYQTGGSAFTVTGGSTLAGNTNVTTAGGALTLDGAVTGSTFDLTLASGTGKTLISGAAGGIGAFSATSTNAAADAISVANVSSATQTYTGKTTLTGSNYIVSSSMGFAGDVTLASSAVIQSMSGATVTFQEGISRTGVGDRNLTVTTSGNTSFGKDVTVDRLQVDGGGLTILGATSSNSFTIAAGEVQIEDAAELRLAMDGTITIDTSGAMSPSTGNIRFGSGISLGAGSAAVSLDLDAGGSSGGNITVVGQVGSAMSPFASFSASGNVVSLNGAITSVAGQSVGGANVILSGNYNTGGFDFIVAGPMIIINPTGVDVTIDSGGALISLTGVFNGNGKNLTLQNFSSASFIGAVSGVRTLTVSNGSSLSFSDALSGNANGDLLVSMLTPPMGTPAVSFGGNVGGFQTISVVGPITLAGDMTATGAITLGDLTLSGASRTIGGNAVTLAAVTGAGANLTINDAGQTVLGGTLSGLGQFSTDAPGSTRFNSNVNLTATGVTIRDSVVLIGGTNVVTASGSGGVDLLGTVNGPAALQLVGGSGGVSIGGATGGTTALTSLTTSGSTIEVGDVRTTGAQSYTGATAFNGGLYRTTDSNLTVTGAASVPGSGDTTFSLGTGTLRFTGSFVSSGGDITVNAGTARFEGTVNGGGSDYIVNATTTVFSDDLTDIGLLRTDAAGTTVLDGNFSGTSLDLRDASFLNGNLYATLGSQTFASVRTRATHQGVNLTFGDIDGNAGNVTILDTGTTNLNGNVSNVVQFFTSAAGQTRLASNRNISADRVIINDAMLLVGGNNSITTTGAQGIALNNTVNGASNLTLTATGGIITLGGVAGGVTNLQSLNATGDSIALESVRTVNAQMYTGATTFGGTTYQTQGGEISVAGTGTFDADSLTTISTSGGRFGVTGEANVSAPVTIQTAGGDVDFGSGSMFTGTTTTINSGGGEIEFVGQAAFSGTTVEISAGSGDVKFGSSSVFSAGSSSVTSAGGNLEFSGDSTFGGTSATLSSGGGDVTFLSGSTFNATTSSVSSGGGLISFVGASSLVSQNLTVDSSGGSGGEIRFGSAATLGLNNAGSVTLTSGGGAINALSSLTFRAPTVTLTSGGGAISVTGATSLATGGVTTVTSGNGNVALSGPISGANALTINAGTGTLAVGQIGSDGTRLTSVSLRGSTVQSGSAFSSGDQVYRGNVTLNGNTYSISGAGNFRVIGATNLASDASITTSEGFLLFQGLIAGAGRTLTLSSGFDSTLTQSAYRFGTPSINVGRLQFNTTGASTFTYTVGARVVTLDVATMVFSDRFNDDGTLQMILPTDTFASTNFAITTPGGFSMSDVDRAVAFGNLSINATGGAADLSWIATLGSLTVAATNLNTYRGSQFLGGDGLNFQGSSFGTLDSTANPANQTTFFSVNAGKTATVNNTDFLNRRTSLETPLTVDRFIAGSSNIIPLPVGLGADAAVTPAILANGKIPGSVAGDIASITAAITDQEASRISTPGVVGDVADNLLNELNLRSKSLDAGDLLQFFVGRSLYLDLPRNYPASSSDLDYAVTRNRLQPETLRETAAAYYEFMGTTPPAPGEKQDPAKFETRLDAHVKALEDAWTAFRAKDPEGGITEFQAFVESNPESVPARQTISELKPVMQSVDKLGLSPLETLIIKRSIVEKIAQDQELASELIKMFTPADQVAASAP